MNVITKKLPKSVWINDEKFGIYTDFRRWITFEEMIQDENLTQNQKIENAIDLVFKKRPKDISIAISIIYAFYSCERETYIDGDNDEDYQEDYQEEQAYSFCQDSGYIYAAFLQCYNLDLTTIKYLHWWKFRALFNALPEYCVFVKIMGYRTAKITNDMPSSEKEHIEKMKKLYALQKSESDNEEDREIEEALMNGGDVSAILEKQGALFYE
ncbi:MAG: bacteriophage Gp15 family protein [Eubacterium sp.]